MWACWCLLLSAMWAMISWRVTGISGWAGRRLAEFQLKKNVTDLCADEWCQAQVADVLGDVVSAPVVHKAQLISITSRRRRDFVTHDKGRRTIDRPDPMSLVADISVRHRSLFLTAIY